MATPVLHLIGGPNGAGKTTFYNYVLEPETALEFVNADLIAAQRWPGDEMAHAYDAAALADSMRQTHLEERTSFVAETVFSHESKVELLADAKQRGYRVVLHVVLIPEDLAAARVVNRVANGGHDVPETKVRERYRRLWAHLATAIALADEAHIYDNTRADAPFRLIATYLYGQLTTPPAWPTWTPDDLRNAGRPPV